MGRLVNWPILTCLVATGAAFAAHADPDIISSYHPIAPTLSSATITVTGRDLTAD